MQVLWPTNEVGIAEDAFPDDDRWRAAIFDALVRATDRHAGNWLAVPRAGEGQQRLKLIDHGHAFDLARGVQTPFYVSRRGQDIPQEYIDALEALDLAGIEDLLAHPEHEALETRRHLLAAGRLDINEP